MIRDSLAVNVLRFSVFEFDPAAPELRRHGRRVPLQDMPLRVLQMLLEHPNELVPRETFFSRLWPHDESGILDDNLNTAVRKLRLALTTRRIILASSKPSPNAAIGFWRL